MNGTKKFVTLGSNNLLVSQLGIGCMGMSEFYGSTDDNESIRTIHRAYELGVNHFDTANCYGFGHNEQLLAKAIKSLDRDKLVIATKCGIERRAEDPTFLDVDNNPQYIKKCCEDSLKRLDVEYIDLFYLHRINPATPLEDSMQAMSELVQAGKIRNIGLSEVSAKTIAKANAIHQITAVQSEYSLWSRDVEKEVLPLCKSLSIGFVAFSPLGNGFLSGKIKNTDTLNSDDMRQVLPRFKTENLAHNLQIVSAIEEIASAKSCTPAQVALAWILAQGDHITAIPGTKRISHLEENMNAGDVKLSAYDLEKLCTTIPAGFAKGSRTLEGLEKFANN
ncbi:MAG: aldo/keto reductase [Burkholderiales bacterium]|jgi:aryl-alcohol dehydrogenase-like predicted oxidoreductase|nr:aldo/keto reductase [Burkholderiales bacterium]